jgi:hypothetical protein
LEKVSHKDNSGFAVCGRQLIPAFETGNEFSPPCALLFMVPSHPGLLILFGALVVVEEPFKIEVGYA